MILPIVAYGDSVLRKVGKEIDSNYPELKQLLANMKATMENAQGVGLAAPQIGRAIRLFLIDASPFAEDEDFPQEERNILKEFKHVFINAKIIKESGSEWGVQEGCLSIPDIREEEVRKEKITVA